MGENNLRNSTDVFKKLQPLWADAFSPVHSWSTVTNPKLNPEWGMYFFPPDKLTARVLDRIVADRCGLALLVAPCTSTLPIHQIRRIQRSPMYFFAVHKDQLTPPEGYHNAQRLDGPPRVTFVATLLSADSCEPEDSATERCPVCSPADTSRRRTRDWPSIVLPGHGGAISSLARASPGEELRSKGWWGLDRDKDAPRRIRTTFLLSCHL